ncbi:4321_t:CDS:2, partial [Funneliformis mosseae]
MSAIYQEIKRLTQELPKENFTKIIAHISKDVNLTNQINDALALFDTDEEKHKYLVNFLESLRAGPKLTAENVKNILNSYIQPPDDPLRQSLANYLNIPDDVSDISSHL